MIFRLKKSMNFSTNNPIFSILIDYSTFNSRNSYAWLQLFRCVGDRMCVFVSIFVITISSERGKSFNKTVAWISWNWWMNVCGKHFGLLHRMHCMRYCFVLRWQRSAWHKSESHWKQLFFLRRFEAISGWLEKWN